MNKLAQEARALCEGATEGPWTASLCEWDCDCENFYSRKGGCDMEPDKCGHGRIINGAFVTETKTVEYSGEFCDMNDADAKLCARSRTLLPEMADEIERLERELATLTADIEAGRLVRLPEFPQDMDDILEPLKVQSALNSEIMKLNFRKEHKPKDVSVLDYTIIAALYKVLTEAEALAAMEDAP
jgi:hypothetical protein